MVVKFFATMACGWLTIKIKKIKKKKRKKEEDKLAGSLTTHSVQSGISSNLKVKKMGYACILHTSFSVEENRKL